MCLSTQNWWLRFTARLLVKYCTTKQNLFTTYKYKYMHKFLYLENKKNQEIKDLKGQFLDIMVKKEIHFYSPPGLRPFNS